MHLTRLTFTGYRIDCVGMKYENDIMIYDNHVKLVVVFSIGTTVCCVIIKS